MTDYIDKVIALRKKRMTVFNEMMAEPDTRLKAILERYWQELNQYQRDLEKRMPDEAWLDSRFLAKD